MLALAAFVIGGAPIEAQAFERDILGLPDVTAVDLCFYASNFIDSLVYQ